MGRIPPKVRAAVLNRDRGCIASLIWPHVCRDMLGQPHPWNDQRPGILTEDHVREHSMMGKTAESTPDHLVVLCVFAHQTSGWALTNRAVLRAHLANPLLVRSVAGRASLRALVHPPPTSPS